MNKDIRYYISYSCKSNAPLYFKVKDLEEICTMAWHEIVSSRIKKPICIIKRIVDKFDRLGFLMYNNDKNLYIWYEETDNQYLGYEIHSANDLGYVVAKQLQLIPVEVLYKEDTTLDQNAGVFITSEN